MYTCLINLPPKTTTIEASKPNTGFVNSAIMLMLKSLVSLRELVLSATLGFTESLKKGKLGIGLNLKIRELIINIVSKEYSSP